MTRPRSRSGLLLLALVLSCAPGFAADLIRVVNEGGIRDEWTLPAGFKLAIPGYPKDHADEQAEACVAIGYLVNPDGSTSDFALLKSWTAHTPGRSLEEYWSAFAQVSAQAVSLWRFQPRPEVASPRPVYTVATFLFAAKSPQLRGRCAIPDLAARLRELRQDASARRKMNSGVFDRLELTPFRMQGKDAMRPGMRG